MLFEIASLAMFLSVTACAQSASGLAGISGVVRDPSGASVPNARTLVLPTTIHWWWIDFGRSVFSFFNLRVFRPFSLFYKLSSFHLLYIPLKA